MKKTINIFIQLMGIMTTLMFYVFPSIGAATYISFRLGP